MAETTTARSGLSVVLRRTEPFALDVALEVAPGEILALVGPSGSGKSTTLRAIAGLTSPHVGTIRCNGQIWFDAAAKVNRPARQRRVGLVFQSYALFPHLTAVENVMEALSDCPRPRRRAMAEAYLARVRLAGLEERRPAELSGGQQQRVAVARALARRPDVLLFDEPFSAVDRMTRLRLQRELAELRDSLSMPVILVTHDLEEAARLADRIAVMHRGAVLQTGATAELLMRPASAAIARLLGIRNVFPAVIAPGAGPGLLHIDWAGRRLVVSAPVPFHPGEPVSWCIAADNVLVHRRDRPSRGDHENPVSGHVRSALRLGATTELVVATGPDGRDGLHCALPTHVARRNGIEPGVPITVSLKADAIHVMPLAPGAGAEDGA